MTSSVHGQLQAAVCYRSPAVSGDGESCLLDTEAARRGRLHAA
jgi:hypothetical protein